MPIEASVTEIADLNASWPLGADAKSTLDSHDRNIKTALRSLMTAGGSNQIGFQSASGISRTVQDKLRERLSVADRGTDSAAFTAAAAAASQFYVPVAAYTVASTPTFSNNFVQVDAGATFSGAAAYTLGVADNCGPQLTHLGTVADQFATQYIRRNASHTGGTDGFVSCGLRVDTYVTNTGNMNYEWALMGRVDSLSSNGQNVGVVGQALRRGTGPVWGMVAEANDVTGLANPTTGMVGIEVDCRANGADTNSQRLGIDVVINRYDTGGALNTVGYGVRIQDGGDVGCKATIAFSVNCTADAGFDTSAATINQAAYKMAAGQAISFDANATKLLLYTAGGLAYKVSTVTKAKFNDTGSLSLVGANQFEFIPTSTSGGQTPTMGTNKPGTTGGAPSGWMSVTVDGVARVMPFWNVN